VEEKERKQKVVILMNGEEAPLIPWKNDSTHSL